MIVRLRPAPILLTLALVVAGASAASADRFSRPFCKKLQVEYADALALGAGVDMEQGPGWAEANLEQERLRNIDRMLNLEADLEFRCSMSRKRIAAIKPERKPVIPEIPERKELPDPPSQTAKAEVEAPAAPSGAAQATKAAATASAGTTVPAAKVVKEQTAAIAPLAPPATAPKTPNTKVAPNANGQAPNAKPATGAASKPVAPGTASKPAQPPAKVATQQAPKPARTKKNKANGYVSPREVVPFGLYRNGSNW